MEHLPFIIPSKFGLPSLLQKLIFYFLKFRLLFHSSDQLTKPQQLVVTFAGGYIAGVFCALVSHPADTIVSKLNSDAGSTAVQAAKELGWKGKR